MTTALLQQVQATLGRDLTAFLPELLLCASIVLLLLLRMFKAMDRLHLGWVALGLSAIALVVSYQQWRGYAFDPRGENAAIDLFTGLLVFDRFTIFLKMFLTAFAFFMVLLTLVTGIPDVEDSADFHVLLLGATLGMILMGSANHLLMIFIAVEMASLPSYALAGFLKGQRKSSEASLKYVVYGGGAAGVMLYGISLLAGKFGTGYLPDVAAGLVTALQGGQTEPLLLLGVMFILVGFAFKVAAVPFHFWCPDVFEGASAEVAGFLSVASKAAALALVARFSLALADAAWLSVEAPAAAWATLASYLAPILAIAAIVTATFGNLAALVQTNLKRLLAYSTIAHAGYMLMGLATLTRGGASAVLFYLVVYLFMNLGAFAIVAFIRNATGSEEIDDHRGLVSRAPVLVISLAVCLLSLLGVPPLAGFAAKFQIFREVYDAGVTYASASVGLPMISSLMYVLLFALGINSVISLVYYIRVLKVMIVDQPIEEVEGREPAAVKSPLAARVYAVAFSVILLVVGIYWDPVAKLSGRGVDAFQPVRVAQRG